MSAKALENLLPLTPLSHHILLVLADRDCHGYAIVHEVERQTGGALRPGTGTLYAALQRMLADGLIAMSARTPRADEDQRRRYYAITDFGREVARAEIRRLARVLEVAAETSLVPEPAPGKGA
jgi:DNA-binding PadR family transcriptional regulator